jgi:hypothetical protein
MDEEEYQSHPQPLWVRVVAVIALLALVGFAIAQVL